MPHNTFNTLDSFDLGDGRRGQFYSLPKLEAAGVGNVSKLPVSIRIVLESVLRNVDGKKITESDVRTLANWKPQRRAHRRDPVHGRARCCCRTSPACRCSSISPRCAPPPAALGEDPKIIEPLVPVDLVVDHSVQVDYSNRPDALQLNMDIEFKRNQQRYQFLKWGMQAFNGFSVVPPGIGIVHQVNLEYLARGVLEKDGVWYPDTLVGTDSHTTMINGLGIVGWGVGGIEAEAGMLGQPVYFLTPDVVGVHLTGALREGVTATDLVLTITEMLRKAKVVGKFVEYFGDGAASLALADRATIANMAPEYGATMGFFPIDEETCRYLRMTGRSEEQVQRVTRTTSRRRDCSGMPKKGDIDYTTVLELDLATRRAPAWPDRSVRRTASSSTTFKREFIEMLKAPSPSRLRQDRSEIARKAKTLVGVTSSDPAAPSPAAASRIPAPRRTRWRRSEEHQHRHRRRDGEQPADARPRGRRFAGRRVPDGRGRAAPRRRPHRRDHLAARTRRIRRVMLAAGLLAKKAVENGLRVTARGQDLARARLARRHRYYHRQRPAAVPRSARLQHRRLRLHDLHRQLRPARSAHRGGDHASTISSRVSVLSGNRNFEARVHQIIKSELPDVAAAGRRLRAGRPRRHRHEPTSRSAAATTARTSTCATSGRRCTRSATAWQARSMPEVVPHALRELRRAESALERDPVHAADCSTSGTQQSTYIQEPPFFTDFRLQAGKIAEITGARALAHLRRLA